MILDRDGTINRNFIDGPVYQIERFELLPGAARAIRVLNDHLLTALLVSNQGGIRHRDRDFDWVRYRQIEAKLVDLLKREADAHLDGFYICEHADYEGCDCRKPKTGLLRRAQLDHGFVPSASYLVGDSANDIVAGADFGLHTILVTSGWERDVDVELAAIGYRPDIVLPDLTRAVEYIIADIDRRTAEA